MAEPSAGRVVTVRPITAAEACIVRAQVLRPHWTPVQCSWPGDDDPRTLHLGGFVGGELVTVASFICEPKDELAAETGIAPEAWIKLRGMATREQHRGTGVGSAVLSEGMAQLAARGDLAAWCNARITAQRFYARHGWQTWGEVFDNPPVGPHVVMWRRLG